MDWMARVKRIVWVLALWGTVGATGCATEDPLATGALAQVASPVRAFAPRAFLAASDDASFQVMPDGTVRAWGTGSYGQRGDGSTSPRLSPGAVSNLTGVVAVEGGYQHAVALRTDGTVWSWGYNGY